MKNRIGFMLLNRRRVMEYFAAISLLAICGSAQGYQLDQMSLSESFLKSGGMFVVNTVEDLPDESVGDGICRTRSGRCSFRAAIQEVNAIVYQRPFPIATGNVIYLPEGRYKIESPPSQLDADSGAFAIVGSVNIRGAGARKTVIDGNGLDQVFDIESTAVVGLSDVTVTGGTSSGIWNAGQLTLVRVAVTKNTGSIGAGIFNTPTSSIIIDSSTISENVASAEGGGIRLDSSGFIFNTTISGNRVLSSCCTESTWDGASAGEGGGIDSRSTGPVTIVNSTIVNNHAVTGGGGLNIAVFYQGDRGGVVSGLNVVGRPIELVNSIVAGNTTERGPKNCKSTIAYIKSHGGNLSDDASCPFDKVYDQNNTDPAIGKLSDNGGATDSHLPYAHSLAKGGGVPDYCPPYDQHLDKRGERCDAGSVIVPGYSE